MEFVADFIRSIPNSPQGLLEFVMNLLLAHGYIVIFLGAALDNFGLPASGDIVLFAGGYFANQGQAALPVVMLSGFAGALVSDNSVYWIGRVGGRPLLGQILKIRFLHFLVDEKSLTKVEHYFETQGGRTVFLGRFGPGLRSMTPLFAGVSRMKYYQFFPYNLAAGTFWAIAYSLVGYIFGEYWDDLLSVAKSVGFGFVGFVALLIALYVIRRRRRRKRLDDE
ncbi:MAG TPA: DedA family protein [Rubrobacteraceae bacterium]|nr:DedA family protein [Rubrobacteraceae bacterium]